MNHQSQCDTNFSATTISAPAPADNSHEYETAYEPSLPPPPRFYPARPERCAKVVKIRNVKPRVLQSGAPWFG